MFRICFVILMLTLPCFPQLSKLSEQLGQLGKKMTVTEIAVKMDPEDGKVRPFETLAIQVLAYGLNGEEKVRLRRSIPQFRIPESGGWVSKPFAFQGKEEGKFFDESSSSAMNIFTDVSGRFVIKDTVLYTAPEKPGKYRIQAALEGKQAEFEVDVATEAPSRRKPEKISFPPENRANDPDRALAEHYAPFIAQETWFDPKADVPVRFDFDGDWHGDNNWESLEEGSSQAYVYYTVMETATHWFVIYNLFHARDYSDRCIIGTCHENDNEGLILTVAKDGTQFGRFQAMETLAHNNVYSVTADRSIRSGAHNIDGEVEFYEKSHPAVFVESGGHGIYGTLCSHSRYSFARSEFLDSTGVTFIYKGSAERPRHANDRLVGYELLPIYEQWWTKTEEGKWTGRTFDGYFRYEPFGGRPGLSFAIGGAFLGRKESSNKAKPFWGWHDTQTLKKRILAVGQWGLDPAYAVKQNLRFPAETPFSLDYVHNPFLGIRRPSQEPAASTPEPAPPPAEQPPSSPVPATPEPAAPPPATSGQVELAAQVDGTVEIHITGAEAQWQVQSGQPVSKESARFSAPLPGVPAGSWTLTKLSGRGKATLVERPSAANGFAARIRVEDSRGGSDFYRLRLQWAP